MVKVGLQRDAANDRVARCQTRSVSVGFSRKATFSRKGIYRLIAGSVQIDISRFQNGPKVAASRPFWEFQIRQQNASSCLPGNPRVDCAAPPERRAHRQQSSLRRRALQGVVAVPSARWSYYLPQRNTHERRIAVNEVWSERGIGKAPRAREKREAE